MGEARRAPAESWQRFRAMSPTQAIIRGSRSTSDRRFKPLSRGRQASAAAAVAIVYAHLLEPSQWTADLLDRVLEYGDRLFRVSKARLRLGDDEHLTTCLLQREFFVGDYKCTICTEPAAVYGHLSSETVGAPSLAHGLRSFLELEPPIFGVLTSQGTSVAVWRHPDSGFFYFDPAPSDERGRRQPSGVACLIRSSELDGILDVFVGNLNRNRNSRYCLDKVSLLRARLMGRRNYCGQGAADSVVGKKLLQAIEPAGADKTEKSKLDGTMPEPQPERELIRKIPLTIEITNCAIEAKLAASPLVEQTLEDERYSYEAVQANVPPTFVVLSGNVAILHGWTHAASDVYKAKGAQRAANCVAAIGANQIRPVRTWLRKSLDDILVLGDAIYAEVKVGKPSIGSVTAADCDGAQFELDGKKMIFDVDLLTIVGTLLSKVPTVVNLKQGIAEFFVKNTDGVLECSSTAVAIWTQDDYYYLFDSQSCDMTGSHLTEEKQGKKNKEEKREKKVVGKCCVVRFADLPSLCGHLLKNLDSGKSNDRFAIRRVSVVEDVPGVRDWNSFKRGVLGKNWILQGSVSGVDESFSEHSRGNQGLAMPVAALVSAKTTAPSNWSKEDVDETVREGDAYYNWCIPAKEEVPEIDPQSLVEIHFSQWTIPGEDEEKILSLKKLKKHLYYKKCKVPIEVIESCVIGDLKAAFDSDLLNLDRGINDFFENSNFGVVEANNKYFAIWKFEEELKDKSKEISYYLYHDKPNEQFLQQTVLHPNKITSSACVIRFLDVAQLANVLKEQLQDDEENNKDEFYIHDIKVGSLSEPMTDEEITKDKAIPIKPELRGYTAVGENGAFLAGSFNQMNEVLFKKDTRDKQQAANALVTLAMTKLFNPHLWSREVVDDILKIGDKISEENSKNLSEHDEEDLEYARNYLMPNEIANNFFLGVNQFAVDIEEDNASGKLNELSKSLEDFFSINKMGIFRVDQIMLPIWREEKVFFTMDPRGKLSGNAGVYWYLDLQTLGEFLLECSETTEADFVIDNVSIENKYDETERSVKEYITEDHWYNFSKISDGFWQIECMVSTKDETFPEEDRGKKSAAICIIAIVFSKVYEPRHWSVEILSEVTITGEKLHARNAERLGTDKSFHPNEIINEFFLANRRIELNIQDCVQAGTLYGRDPNVQNVITGISKFFDKFTSGCLSISGSDIQHLAIWKYDNFFYSFKPGVSLTRFENVSLLGEQLSMNKENDTDFEITSIDVIDWNKLPPWKFDPSPAVRPSNLPVLNAYRRLSGEARAILCGSTHQASQVFPESIRGRQTASNCITALAMSIIKNPITWTRAILDEILTFGIQLHRESLKSTTKTNTLKPKDIVRIFHIGVNVLAVDVEEATVTGIVAHPPPEPEEKGGKTSRKSTKRKSSASKDKKKGKPKRTVPLPPPPLLLEDGLNNFFENNNAGILVTGRYMVAIWKNSGVYFMYDPRPRNKEGLKDDNDTEGTSCVIWFACKEPLYDLISKNINDDEKFSKFEICRIIIKTVPIEPLPSPAGYKAIDENILKATISACSNPPILPTDLQQEPQSKDHLDVDLETSFEQVDRELSIVLGKSHMSQRDFPAENRGHQSSAIAAVAIVIAVLHAPSTWTASIIDAVLKYGDVLYTECARLSQPGSRNLSPSELLSVFIVGDVRATISLEKNVAAGITLEEDLETALNLFFASNSFGIMHTVSYAIPVMEQWGKFYFLDPSGRNRFKMESFEGVACLMKCENLTKLAKTIIQVCAFKEPTVYTLNTVQVLDLHFFT